MNWMFNQGASNSRAALADPVLRAALVQNAAAESGSTSTASPSTRGPRR